MKKKLLIILSVLVLVSSALSASFLQLGPNYSIAFPVDTESSTPVDVTALDFQDFRLGADVRFNLGYLTIEEGVKASFTDELLLSSFDVSTLVGLRANVWIFDFLVGAGLRCTAVKSEESKWLFNGALEPDALECVKTSTLFYKGAVDINMGRLVTLSLSAILPVNQTINSLNEVQNVSVVDALTPSLKDMTVSVGLLFNFF